MEGAAQGRGAACRDLGLVSNSPQLLVTRPATDFDAVMPDTLGIREDDLGPGALLVLLPRQDQRAEHIARQDCFLLHDFTGDGAVEEPAIELFLLRPLRHHLRKRLVDAVSGRRCPFEQGGVLGVWDKPVLDGLQRPLIGIAKQVIVGRDRELDARPVVFVATHRLDVPRDVTDLDANSLGFARYGDLEMVVVGVEGIGP